MAKINKELHGVHVLVYPWEKGFTCKIISPMASKLTIEEKELCNTIARGMVKVSTDDPHKTFMLGMQGFAEDRRDNTKSNLIDFLDYLKIKRNRDLINKQ